MQEIERKFLPVSLPEGYEEHPHREIIQGYLSRDPAIRVRSSRGRYRITIKGGGMMSHTEDSFDLGSEEAFLHLLSKCDGRVIRKTRYVLPIKGYPGLKAELDVFEGELEGLVMLEVEFPDEDAAAKFRPPLWYGEDVTADGRYYNSYLSVCEEIPGCPLMGK
ncbi:MAG: CYTH domain-containing protein [Lachnospiraceae bacterium]|nr:CYTH domain-containing protein [Lachnospiraceae bacterium]